MSKPLTLQEWLERLNKSLPGSLIVLLLVNFFIYRETVDGYFLADDFVHVAFLQQVFHGHPELLAKNFYSTWMQTEGTQFYRPFISLTLALDYILGGGLQPLAFHITNLLYQVLSSLGMYLLTAQILRRAHQPASFAPLLAGLLFAAHPLHVEVVSWIIARVDSVCCAFYLLAFFFFLRANDRSLAKESERRPNLNAWLGGVCFTTSLLSKEMAVTLPLSLSLCLLLFPDQADTACSGMFKRLAGALKATWPAWLILILYLVFRALALGSAGGYQGSIGEGLSSSTWARIFSLSSCQKVIFPLNAEIFVPLKRQIMPLLTTYVLILTLCLSRFVLYKSRAVPLRLLGFSILWFLIVMAPTIPVWNLTDSLQGARFIYLGTAPICLFLAALVTPRPAHPDQVQAMNKIGAVLNGAAVTISLALVVIFSDIAMKNNSAWARAGNELKSMRQAIESQIDRLPQPERMALLNIPHTYKGAHMLYNAATLSVLLEPPLSKKGIYERLDTFEPPLFGDDDLIRASRVRRLLSAETPYHFFYWDRNEWKLLPLSPVLMEKHVAIGQTGLMLETVDIDSRGNPAGSARLLGTAGSGTSPVCERLARDSVLLSPVLDVSACSADFLDICLSARRARGSSTNERVPVVVEWNSEPQLSFREPESFLFSLPGDGIERRIRLHVSEHKKWLKSSTIHRLGLWSPLAPGDVEVAVTAVELSSGDRSIPVLLPDPISFPEDQSGVARTSASEGTFSYDASKVDNAHSILFEISQRDAWFEHYSNTFKDKEPSSKAMQSWRSNELKNLKATFKLNKPESSGFFELRLAALDKTGRVAGYFSEPIMFQIGR